MYKNIKRNSMIKGYKGKLICQNCGFVTDTEKMPLWKKGECPEDDDQHEFVEFTEIKPGSLMDICREAYQEK